MHTRTHTRVVTVSLKQVGAAPALKKKKFLVEGDRTIAWIIQWLSKQLRCEENETVVCVSYFTVSNVIIPYMCSSCTSNRPLLPLLT